MSTHTIFYSWQSDSPNSTNRGFIEDCLEKAIKAIKLNESLKLAPCIDRDTANVPGSPDIAATIFDKIKAAHIFVGDVTFIDDGAARRCPNPNVLLELGFAASCLGWNRIICVFNEHFGRPEDLPFDLRFRRVRRYSLAEGAEKTEQRKLLVRLLSEDITHILCSPDEEQAREHSEFVSSLARIVIPGIIAGLEVDNRTINPWLAESRSTFEYVANELRQLAATDIAIDTSLVGELEELADAFEQPAVLVMHSGSYPTYASLTKTATDMALSLKTKVVDILPLSDDSQQAVRKKLIETYRQLDQLSRRLEKMKFKDCQQQAASHGEALIELSLYSIDSIQDGLATQLRTIGTKLHLIEIMSVCMDGGASIRAIHDEVRQAVSQLSVVVEGMTQK